ncbi:MAG TPA: hypothetical protein VGI65_03585 [Steroidobacteraceae bacterium]|jgi:hypothetical protein
MSVLDFPILLFLMSIVLLSVSAWAGLILRGRKELEGESREDFGVVLAASLTLLGLIIGFSFSMATSRYDQRKNYEEAEANAIGTEFVRVDLLPAAEAASAKRALAIYLRERVLWYKERDSQHLRQIDEKIAQLQNEMWTAVKVPAAAQPNPLLALVVSGMNDVLNSQGYTQAAWWNRIPVAAWFLMVAIAVLCNGMMGYGAGIRRSRFFVIMILPVIVSISFYLIADIDSPRGGLVQVVPQNLLSLVAGLPQ